VQLHRVEKQEMKRGLVKICIVLLLLYFTSSDQTYIVKLLKALPEIFARHGFYRSDNPVGEYFS